MTPAAVTAFVGLNLGVHREARGNCFVCRTRRVLYRLTVWSGSDGLEERTEARCAPCWGIR